MAENLNKRVERLEQRQEPTRPDPVVIYDASKPGDAEQKAAEYRRKHGGNAVYFLMPDNGRDPQWRNET